MTEKLWSVIMHLTGLHHFALSCAVAGLLKELFDVVAVGGFTLNDIYYSTLASDYSDVMRRRQMLLQLRSLVAAPRWTAIV